VRCTSPRTVGFQSDGKTLCWSSTKYSKEYATFQLPCGKCLACRLEYARQTAIRCVHEASMYEENSFITLTYSDENLKNPKLQYRDFQLFVKRLRSYIAESDYDENKKIGIFVTGEYGDKTKRPHWHALIFNWRPSDLEQKYVSARGDKVFTSKILERLWPFGFSELGDVTLQSAGYCARYATKKLSHGRDGSHEFNPVSKRSSKHAIGKKWLEKFWPDVFNHGYVELNGIKMSIPRYYEKWFKKHHPERWKDYVTQTKTKIIREAVKKEEKITLAEKKANLKRNALTGLQITRNAVRKKILEQKTKFAKEQKC